MLAGRPTSPAGVTDLEALANYLRRLPQPVSPSDDARFILRH